MKNLTLNRITAKEGERASERKSKKCNLHRFIHGNFSAFVVFCARTLFRSPFSTYFSGNLALIWLERVVFLFSILFNMKLLRIIFVRRCCSLFVKLPTLLSAFVFVFSSTHFAYFVGYYYCCCFLLLLLLLLLFFFYVRLLFHAENTYTNLSPMCSRYHSMCFFDIIVLKCSLFVCAISFSFYYLCSHVRAVTYVFFFKTTKKSDNVTQ